jgi:hypothetical protein
MYICYSLNIGVKMRKADTISRCDCCDKQGEDLSLLLANHKERGWVKVCKECWAILYSENAMVAGTGTSGSVINSSPCSSCPGCRF